MNEIDKVEELGKAIGYGHLMELASSLWRKSLKNKDYPISGAFVPTILLFIKEDEQEHTKKSCMLYDKLISNHERNKI